MAGPVRAAAVPAGQKGGFAALCAGVDRLRLALRGTGHRESGRGGPPSVTLRPEE